MNNKLIIAAAGSGKTTYLVKEALKIKNDKVLITTFTESNENEIFKKFIKINGFLPSNIVIQTWFSFLLQHGVRPYQDFLTEKRINGLLLVNQQSGIKYTYKDRPVYFSEEKELETHYFSKEYKIYSDKISKFVYRCNEKSLGLVIDRIQRIYPYIFIDEIQDMAGYDLELIKLFLMSFSSILMVGDPRQVTYHTHDERMNVNYNNGDIERYIIDKCKKIPCEIDKTTLNKSYRNNQLICDFACKLYPNYDICDSEQKLYTDHDGIFLVRKSEVSNYLKRFEPIQLRDSVKRCANEMYPVMNFGISKGLTFDRVLIYPTDDMIKWIKNRNTTLKDKTKAKFYVALTRAQHSVAIEFDYNANVEYEGVIKYS